MVNNGTACRFVSVVTKTPVVKIKAANPWNAGAKTESGLYKISQKIGVVNANYNLSVRNRIADKLGVDLSSVEYTGGKSSYIHIMTNDGKPSCVLVKASNPNDGVFYLQYFPHKSFHNTYVNETGETVLTEDVKPWLYVEKERPSFKPCVIAPKFSNILKLKATGVIFETPEFEEAEAILAQ